MTRIVFFIMLATLASATVFTSMRTRELMKNGAEAAVAEVTPEPTVEEMEEAAGAASDEHNIYDRIVALTGNVQQLVILVPGHSLGITEVRLWSDDDTAAVRVRIDSKTVYEQIGWDIRTYLGMGEWEHLLGEVEQKVAADREETFRSARERRFGPLPGWGDDN